jgi:glycosyltransferase involved in cell wall biosynthesis
MISRHLRILYVAYPLLPVSDSICGGAEQVLVTLEAEMARRCHTTVVAACSGSRVAGKLLPTGAAPVELDQYEEREAVHHARILDLLRRHPAAFDLVHDMSGSFWRHAGELDVPVLATLHLPRSWSPDSFRDLPPNLLFNCVSQSQALSFDDLPHPPVVIRNGVRLEAFPFTMAKQGYLLWLGRICEEKGAHLALDVAERAGLPIVIAGQVYPFTYHQHYFEREVRPRLRRRKGAARFVDAPAAAERVELLRHARALLLPALAEETSSLVSVEAMACGTPVIAFRRGALPEIVVDGVTGFLVNSVEEMAAVLPRASGLDPSAARKRVDPFHSAARLADHYELLYQGVLAQGERTLHPCHAEDWQLATN